MGGGGVTEIGDNNVFMAYVHVAHDCHVGNNTIFGNMATLGGHVHVEDFANVSAGSGVHQFCRVGRYAFIGGYSVVTKDALPYARTVGNRARIYGLNTIGLIRRGFTSDTITRLKRTFRYLLQSKLNTSAALQHIEDYASSRAQERLTTALALLEPTLLAGLTAVVGGIALSFFLPLFSLLGGINAH